MKKQQVMTIKMCNRLINFLSRIDVTILGTIPFLLIWFTDIKSRLIALGIEIQAFDNIIEGYQKAKKIARVALVQAFLDMAVQIQAYANSVDNVVLFENISFTKTLLERCNPTDFLAFTQNILDKAIANLINLADFGITQDIIDAYTQTRNIYVTAEPKPEEAKEQREAANLAVEVGLKAIMLLWKKIDIAMRGAAVTQPLLAQNYFRARKIDNPPTRTFAVIGLVTNLLGQPMPFVTLTCETLKLNRKTTKKGRFIINAGPHMQHILICNYPGYKEARRTVTITTGLRKNIVIMMEENES